MTRLTHTLPAADHHRCGLPDRGDREACIAANRHDLAGRRHLGARLEASEARFRRMFECAGVGIAITTLDGRFVQANPALSRAIGYGPEELRDTTFPHLMDRADRRVVARAVRALLAGDATSETAEIRAIARSGRAVSLRCSFTLLRDRDGTATHVMGTVEDVTAAREAHDRLAGAEQARQRAEQHVLRMQRMESLGALASGLAHDLSNAMAIVQMAVDSLRHDHGESHRAATLDTIERSTRRSAEMIQSLLSFARGTRDPHDEVDVADLLHELAGVCERTFPDAITLQHDVPGDLWPVTGDATQLHQVLANLCVNARDAMPAGGRLVVTARNLVVDRPRSTPTGQVRPGSYVEITVSDTGPGMTAEEVEAALEPFVTTKSNGQGSGLGLPTSRTIVEQHDGTLLVDTAPGHGTTVQVHLPAA